MFGQVGCDLQCILLPFVWHLYFQMNQPLLIDHINN